MVGLRPYWRRWLLATAVMSALVAVFAAPGRWLRRRARDTARSSGRRLRYGAGRARGALYRERGGHPELDVDDPVLADRVRSQLGRVEKRLDIPRVHVMVDDHVVLLHGEVPTDDDRRAVEHAASEVAGVEGVESYLHVGLVAGDTRPSEGKVHRPPSEAMTRLLGAARSAGSGEHGAPTAVRSVLAALTERLPADERDQFLGHLPADVRSLVLPPWRHGRVAGPHGVDEFVQVAAGAAGRDPETAKAITESVLGTLRQLVPEEAADVAAVLPAELRRLWNAAVPL